MLTGTNFDKGKDIVETFKLIKEKGIPIPSSLNPQCRQILQQMLMLDPTKRSNCEEILQLIRPSERDDHSGMTNVNKNENSSSPYAENHNMR